MIATLATATPTLSHHASECIADTVYEPSRIRLGDDKQALVSGRRAKRLRHLHRNSYDESCAYLESTRGPDEIDQLVDCISTNHTHFFREIEQLNFLRDVALPEWVPRLTREGAPFKFWSAASSSGEEPYPVAIVLAEYARAPGSFHWQIEDSDISSRILAKAQAAIYEESRIALPQPEWLPRYFQKGTGDFAGPYKVKATLTRQVKFHRLNLRSRRSILCSRTSTSSFAGT